MKTEMKVYNVLFMPQSGGAPPYPKVFSTILESETYIDGILEKHELIVSSNTKHTHVHDDLSMDLRCEDKEGNCFYICIYEQVMGLDEEWLDRYGEIKYREGVQDTTLTFEERMKDKFGNIIV